MSNCDSGNGGLTGHSFKTHTIEEIHNSEFTRNIQEVSRGYKPVECNTCWVKEKNGYSKQTYIYKQNVQRCN